MIYVGPHTFEICESKNKLLKLKCAYKEEMGPYRSSSHGLVFSPAIAEAYRNTVLKDLYYAIGKIRNEDYLTSVENISRLETLAKHYATVSPGGHFASIWEKWYDETFSGKVLLEARNRLNTEDDNMKKIRAFKEEIKLSDLSSEINQARIDYLENQNTNLSSHLALINSYIQKLQDCDVEGWFINLYKEMSECKMLAGKLHSNRISIACLKGTYSEKKTVITDDMIEVAKRVPFDRLIKLETVGNMKRALCPFHNEKTPSFYVYPNTNRGYCHGCRKSVDTIQYLIETEKINFNEAVLMLLSY